MRQRSGTVDASLPATRKLAQPLGCLGQVDQRHQELRPAARLGAPESVQAGLQDEQLTGGREPVDADLLHSEPDPAADFLRLGNDVAADDARAPGAGPHERADHRDDCLLACANRA